MEALSPELALVDAQLAVVARAALAPASDVFAVLERSRANRDVVRRMRETFVEHEAAAAERAATLGRSTVRRRMAGIVFASSAAAGAIVTGALALGRDDVSSPRALAANAPAAPPRPAVTRHRSVGKAVVRRTAPVAKPKPARRARPAASVATPKPRVAPKPTHEVATPVHRKPHAAVETRPAAAPVLSWPVARQATYYRVRVYRMTGQFLFEVWADSTRLKVPSTWRTGGKENRLAPGRYGWAVYPAFGDLGEPSDDPTARTPLTGGHFTV